MNYLESLAYIESLALAAQKPCLERIAAFMDENGRLQDRFHSFHVAGTNGKGSTVAMLDAVLRQSDMKVGRFTGPHLLAWNERFHVNGRPIADDCFADLASRLRLLSEDFGCRHPDFGPLTWFEYLTAIAFWHFAESKVDVAVLEVGLGGRWDATNIVSPAVTGITNVDLDHVQILGDTVSAIALEKAGIIKAGCPVVTAAAGAALDQIVRVAAEREAPVLHCKPSGTVSAPGGAWHEAILPVPDELLQCRRGLSLPGQHQQLNALVALSMLHASGLAGRLTETAVCAALGNVYWPGRLQFLPGRQIVLDGAHNHAGARALRHALDQLFPGKHALFVAGCFGNKDVPMFVEALLRQGDRLIACQAAGRRETFPSGQIAELARGAGIPALAAQSVAEALSLAGKERLPDEIIVVTGSFATVREAMLEFGWSRVEDGIPETEMDWSNGEKQLVAK